MNGQCPVVDEEEEEEEEEDPPPGASAHVSWQSIKIKKKRTEPINGCNSLASVPHLQLAAAFNERILVVVAFNHIQSRGHYDLTPFLSLPPTTTPSGPASDVSADWFNKSTQSSEFRADVKLELCWRCFYFESSIFIHQVMTFLQTNSLVTSIELFISAWLCKFTSN